jgi:exodeoxyribonuclease VII small subunit
MPKSAVPAIDVSTEAGLSADAMAPEVEPASYESALAELERLVEAMEGEQLPLDQVLRAYQRGARLLAYCRSRLDAVEQQVKVLEDGQLKPWINPRDQGEPR